VSDWLLVTRARSGYVLVFGRRDTLVLSIIVVGALCPCHAAEDHSCISLTHLGAPRVTRIQPWPEKRLMVELDAQLIFDARRFLDGTNEHRLKEMIAAYEQAVYLQNDKSATYQQNPSQAEVTLRAHVLEYQMAEVSQRSMAAVKQANACVSKSRDLHAKSREINDRINRQNQRKGD
jgi:hypothetical protein